MPQSQTTSALLEVAYFFHCVMQPVDCWHFLGWGPLFHFCYNLNKWCIHTSHHITHRRHSHFRSLDSCAIFRVCKRRTESKTSFCTSHTPTVSDHHSWCLSQLAYACTQNTAEAYLKCCCCRPDIHHTLPAKIFKSQTRCCLCNTDCAEKQKPCNDE